MALEPRREENKIPKCISVGFLSDYKEEREILFYSQYNQLKIYDIIDGATLKQHTSELSLFNKFQSLLQNEEVIWDSDLTDIDKLSALIKYQLNKKETELRVDIEEYTEYGLELFDFFCKHQDRIQIAIHDFNTLPDKLFNALFVRHGKTSLLSIATLFPCLQNLSIFK